MFLALRGWWYAKGFGKAERMPRDVREYIIRRFLKVAVQPHRTPEEKRSFAAHLLKGAYGPDADKISPELLDETIRVAFELGAGPARPLPPPPPDSRTVPNPLPQELFDTLLESLNHGAIESARESEKPKAPPPSGETHEAL
jgi:hypothetical protein